MKLEVILDKKDFEFIDYFCDKYAIPEGKGHKSDMAILLNEYKHKMGGD